VEDQRVLIGTAHGLASLEGDRVCWYKPNVPGLEVTALTRLDRWYVLATNQGLMLLDGPALVARHPLGSGGGAGRVTALSADGRAVWASTAGAGLWRLQIEGGETLTPAAGRGTAR
jgi:hypothetical protein